MSEKQNIVLVAEDDSTLRFLAKKQLGLLGYQCHLVQDGVQAVERTTKHDYAAILMDVQMPRMSGIEATLAIRSAEKQAQKPETPIIAMTANPDKEKCLTVGMNDFIFKPIMLDSLQQVLSRWIS
jgi:two-component system, sensor histidine kinase and response regulator